MAFWDVCRYDIINQLIKKYNYKRYLEIGINTGENFQCINIEFKEGIDPDNSLYHDIKYVMPSDDFFNNVAPTLGYKYDIVFIDGLHEFHQVTRDIENSFKYLTDGGCVLMHDCSPTDERVQIVPRIYAPYWTGDVWKAVLKQRMENPNVKIVVVNTDLGVGIIQKGKQILYTPPEKYAENPYVYSHLDENRDEILHLISTDKFFEQFTIPKPNVNYIKLNSIVDTSCYASAGTVSNENDLEMAESYIAYNKDFINSFPYIVTSNNKMSNSVDELLLDKYNNIWKDYFGDKVINLPAKENRGHTFGIFDVENAIFEYTKLHRDKIKWVWKFAFDILCNTDIFETEVEEADFYYVNNIGYQYLINHKFDMSTAFQQIKTREYFYPQTPYYIMRNIIDELNDTAKVDEFYNIYANRPNKSMKPWECIPWCDCESFLKSCIEKNNLRPYYLLHDTETKDLLNIIYENNMVDGSLKNIMFKRLGNLCHFQYPDKNVITI